MSSQYRVLIVEDEPLMRDYLTGALSGLHPAFVVADAAHDGISALALFENSSYDLVITDLRMPGRDGLQLSPEPLVQGPELLDVRLGAPDKKVAQLRPQLR